MRAPSSTCHRLPGSLLTALLVVTTVTACRAPYETSDSPGDTTARPFVVEKPLTAAEVARNERFEDLRRTRSGGAVPAAGTPIPASASRD